MLRLHHLPARLIRRTSVCISFALIVASLTTISIKSAGSKGSNLVTQGHDGQTNSRGKTIDQTPPAESATEASKPSIDETGNSAVRVNTWTRQYGQGRRTCALASCAHESLAAAGGDG